MNSTYHFNSAIELNNDIIEAIKLAFKSKPITLTITEERDDTTYLLKSEVNKKALLKSIEEDKAGKSVQLKKRK